MADTELIPSFEEITGPKPQSDKQDSTSTNGNGSNGKTKEPAQFWLNVGVERNGKLLTLPMGIPLDKLKSKPVPNKQSEFQQLRAGEKALWDQFRTFFEGLKPGESKRVNFVCEVRRINEAELIEEDTNPFAPGKLSFT